MLPEEGRIQLNRDSSALSVGNEGKKLRRETKHKNTNLGVISLETVTETLGGEKHAFHSQVSKR